jgi:hypothetical protein
MTARVHERLILDGEATFMACCPPLPEGHPRIVELNTPDAQGDLNLFSTACWRGYRGSREVKDGRLYPTGLGGKLRLQGTEPLFAEWFSGILWMPRGEMIQYIHVGFGTVYEQELLVRIEDGVVTDSRLVDNRGKRWDLGNLSLEHLPGRESAFPGDGDT